MVEVIDEAMKWLLISAAMAWVIIHAALFYEIFWRDRHTKKQSSKDHTSNCHHHHKH